MSEKCNNEFEIPATPGQVRGKDNTLVMPFNTWKCTREPGHSGNHRGYGAKEVGGVVVRYIIEWGNPQAQMAPDPQKTDFARAEEEVKRVIEVQTGFKEKHEHYSQGEQHRRFDDGNGNTLLTTFLSTEQVDEE
jgi:hypothetical protein